MKKILNYFFVIVCSSLSFILTVSFAASNKVYVHNRTPHPITVTNVWHGYVVGSSETELTPNTVINSGDRVQVGSVDVHDGLDDYWGLQLNANKQTFCYGSTLIGLTPGTQCNSDDFTSVTLNIVTTIRGQESGFIQTVYGDYNQCNGFSGNYGSCR